MAELPEGYELAQRLLTSLTEWFAGQLAAESATDPMLLTKVAALALNQYYCALAVDINMTEDQVINITKFNLREAKQKAPRFG